jgi:hypothetical protein
MDSHIVTLAVAEGLVEPLYTQTFFDLSTASSLDPRSTDDLCSIGEYDPRDSALHFAVFIAPAAATVDAIAPSDRYQRWLIPYHRFSTIVVAAYSWAPSMRDGWILHFATAQPRYDGIAEVGEYVPSRGETPDAARDLVESMFVEAHVRLFEAGIKVLSEDQKGIPGLQQHIRQRLALGIQAVPSKV